MNGRWTRKGANVNDDNHHFTLFGFYGLKKILWIPFIFSSILSSHPMMIKIYRNGTAENVLQVNCGYEGTSGMWSSRNSFPSQEATCVVHKNRKWQQQNSNPFREKHNRSVKKVLKFWMSCPFEHDMSYKLTVVRFANTIYRDMSCMLNLLLQLEHWLEVKLTKK